MSREGTILAMTIKNSFSGRVTSVLTSEYQGVASCEDLEEAVSIQEGSNFKNPARTSLAYLGAP